MITEVHIYYTVDFIVSGGQGFSGSVETLATFEYEHEAREYAFKYKKEHDICWGYIEVREHIER